MRYLRKMGTTEIFVWTPFLAARPDMEEYTPPNGETVDKNHVPPPEPEYLSIRQAIKAIPREQWAKAAFGRPAMPKVDDVSKLTGFEVERGQIIECLKAIAEEG